MSSKLNDINVLAVNAAPTIISGAIATSITSPPIDMMTCDNNCFAIQYVGIVAGTETVFVGNIQECENTTVASFTNLTAFSTVTSTTGVGGVQLLNFQRTKRFLRYSGTITGTTAAVALAGFIVGQKKEVT